jgi:hypothetical protein
MMGRLADLCAEIAAEAEETDEGQLVLSADTRSRLREDWSDDEIDDALSLVGANVAYAIVVETADSLSARMVDVLGTFGSEEGFARAAAGTAQLSLETIEHLVRRVDSLEEMLTSFREGSSPVDHGGFDELKRRLAGRDAGDVPAPQAQPRKR